MHGVGFAVNGRDVPLKVKDHLVLAEVQFGQPQVPQPASLQGLWPTQVAPIDASGAVVIESGEPVNSLRTAGSGIYEIDMVCGFDAGGFFFRADAEQKKGLLAVAMLSWFPPMDGNIGLWDANFPKFAITWTLGKTLKNGQHYRFRIESYGDRHSFSVLDPVNSKVLVEPLTYCVETVEPEGFFGILLKKGKTRVTRFALASSELTQQIQPLQVKPEAFLQEAFTTREMTRKMGQRARPGTKKVIGRDASSQIDYAIEQGKMWSAK